MRILPIILIIALIFLPACITTDSIQKKNDSYADKISQEESFMVEQGAGAAVATKIILEKSPQKDIHTESARKTINLSVEALPDLTIKESDRWEKIATDLILGNEKGLEAKRIRLIQSENEKIKLKKKLEEGESKLLDVYAQLQSEQEDRIEEMKRDQELKKDLVKYFFYAAAVCVLAGGILSYFLGIKMGINAIIAGGFFSLAAYLVTQPFFSYMAAGFAVTMFVGTIYYVWGKVYPEKTLERQVKVIEKMGQSGDARKRDAAKIFKDEMGSSLAESKSEKAHRELVRKLKK